jgi:hypothetical protein
VNPPTRAQKRWGPRLRTAGALLLLLGVVALVDRALPGSSGTFALPAGAQVALGAGAVSIGLVLFVVGRRWR